MRCAHSGNVDATPCAAGPSRGDLRLDVKRSLVVIFGVLFLHGILCVSGVEGAFGKSLRERLILADSTFDFSSGVRLTSREKNADAALSRLRSAYFQRFALHPDLPHRTPFLVSRSDLKLERLHRVLRTMPKGGLLHVHATATGSVEWIVERALSMPDCYIYWEETNDRYVHGQLGFFPNGCAPAGWMLLTKLKAAHPNIREELEALFSLGPEDLGCPDMWKEFETIFARIDGFISYRPVFLDYYRDAFERLAGDNIQFLELRTSLDPVLTEDGGQVVDEAIIDLYQSIVEKVRTKYQGFDLAVIVCSYRQASIGEVRAKMTLERKLAAKYPEMIVGFDMVGEEDRGRSNHYYAAALGSVPAVPLFLHAGESLSPTNHNVLDAWLLGSQRIAHAINLVHFPALERRIRDSGTVLELCPISNQSLGYVPDLRLHPGRGYLLRGIRCVLGSDDPAIFRNEGLTDDFWEAYIAWGLDLRSLKHLTGNSILYSNLPPLLVKRHLETFTRRWNTFIRAVNATESQGKGTSNAQTEAVAP